MRLEAEEGVMYTGFRETDTMVDEDCPAGRLGVAVQIHRAPSKLLLLCQIVFRLVHWLVAIVHIRSGEGVIVTRKV